MPTKAGLPGWFPENFSTDPALQAAFEDTAGWHAAGPGRKPGKAAVKAKLRAAHPRNRAAAGRSSEHAATWDDVASVVELAAAAAVPGQQIAAGQPAAAAAVSPAKSANATVQPRVGAGSPAGGQFAPAGSGGGSGKPMDAHQQHVAHLQHLATHGTPAQQQAAKALLAKMTARQKTGTAPKATTSKTATAKAPATAKSTAKTAPKASTSKAGTSKTAKSTSKAASSKTASTSAKATAHQQHTAHVAHLQHLATHGNPAQQKAALAVLAKLGVKP